MAMAEDEFLGVDLEPVQPIDYSSTKFILQNLKLQHPQLSDESTTMLTARKEAAETVSIQLCFYIFCILHAFDSEFETLKVPKDQQDEDVTSLSTKKTSKFKSKGTGENVRPLILIVGGTGYIAQHTIHMLTKHGLKSRILIFCRGDITAGVWRSKGYRAHHIIGKLLGLTTRQPIKPDIFVSFTSNSSFTQVCRSLAGIPSQSSVFLFCTLGLARQKAYYMFRAPTVLRSYIEPYFTLYRLQGLPQYSAAADDDDIMDDEEEEVSYEEVVKQGLQDDEFDDFLVDKTIWDELKSRHFDKTELAAEYLARRFVNIVNFVNLIENFYAIRGLFPSVARRLALKVVLGHIETKESAPDPGCDSDEVGSGFVEAVNTGIEDNRDSAFLLMKKNIPLKDSAIAESSIEGIIDSMMSDFGKTFQRLFSTHILAVDIPKTSNMAEADSQWLKNRLQHDLSYTRDEEMSMNGGFPMYTEDDLSKIFSRDKNDFYNSHHLEECASDDEGDAGKKESADLSDSIVLPAAETKTELEAVIDAEGDSEILKHLPDWLQDKFTSVKQSAEAEREQLEKNKLEQLERERIERLEEERQRELEVQAHHQHELENQVATSSSGPKRDRFARRSSVM